MLNIRKVPPTGPPPFGENSRASMRGKKKIETETEAQCAGLNVFKKVRTLDILGKEIKLGEFGL